MFGVYLGMKKNVKNGLKSETILVLKKLKGFEKNFILKIVFGDVLVERMNVEWFSLCGVLVVFFWKMCW
jgi:hypothetical protein